MPYHLRPLDIAIDLPRIVELVNTVNAEPVSQEAFRTRQEREVPGRVLQRELPLHKQRLDQRSHASH